MAAHTITNEEIKNTLHSVIETLIDGQEGFQKIGEHLKDDTLKQYFLAESLKRAQFRGEIETLLHTKGDHDPKESGTASGALRRAWGDLKARLGGSDHTLLETAEQGEDAAKKAYKEALEKELPLPAHQLLSTQYAHIQQSHDYLKAARDSQK
ncbi:MAG: PA2169 family four-helix-bundle protein [Silvibacterium sp.]|nr:PA2169 family four-helix-bundle protein [Silvibacterium sp.]